MKTQEERHKVIVGTFGTVLGQKLMAHLKETILDKPTYKKGMTLDEVAFNEGRKDIVNQLLKEMK